MDKVTRVLASCQYVLLTTFQRDGTPMPTPLRVVGDGGSLAVWPVRDPMIIGCLQGNAGVEVAPCDIRGIPRGRAVAGRARMLDPDEFDRVQELMVRKYGVLGRTFLTTSRLRQGEGTAQALSITVGPVRIARSRHGGDG